MTTDYGIDLVAVEPKTYQTVTIQVKACGLHEDSTSRWVVWNMPKQCIADWVAVVDIERDKCWLFTKDKFKDIGTRTGGDGLRLWWYVPGHRPMTSTLTRREEDFRGDEIAAVVPKLFSIAA